MCYFFYSNNCSFLGDGMVTLFDYKHFCWLNGIGGTYGIIMDDMGFCASVCKAVG